VIVAKSRGAIAPADRPPIQHAARLVPLAAWRASSALFEPRTVFKTGHRRCASVEVGNPKNVGWSEQRSCATRLRAALTKSAWRRGEPSCSLFA
jgi:hypothetical protein